MWRLPYMALNTVEGFQRQETLDRAAEEIADRIREGEPFKLTIEVHDRLNPMVLTLTEHES